MSILGFAERLYYEQARQQFSDEELVKLMR